MAEAAVAVVINKAIAAKALLQGEGHHLQENISWIETQMKALQSYLKDVEPIRATDFINGIRDLALDVEDILDSYLLEIESHKSKGPFGFLKHSSCIPCYAVTDRYLSLEIDEIKKRAAEIEKSKRDMAAKSNDDRQIWNQTNQFQKKLFGRDEIQQKIEAEMFSEKKKCRTISIVGPGGVGKTTLAMEIYLRVKSKFDYSAMVYISEESSFGEIILSIAKQVGLRESRMKQNIEEHLYSFLCSKKYVIFLDDVSDKWDVLKDVVMTDSRNGSRIIVTCREQVYPKLVFSLDLLSDSEGKEVFYDLILPTSEETLSPVLKNIGDKIVQKCGGLPLAIEVAAGILRLKERTEYSWNEVLEKMSEGGENDSLKILDLSYQDLPVELKPFFLYFGIFPMNREIFVLELIQLWVAEKLVIQVDESREPKKIVEAYLDKLTARNLIQVSRRKSDGRIRSWRIHRFLNDLCARKVEEINFFCNWNNLRNADLASTARRLITNSSSSLSDQKNFENFTVPRKLRTLLCFGKAREIAKFIKSFASELSFLQLLTIEAENIAINIPVEIADLSGLIYLKLIGEYITVPSSIQGLKKLETLEVRSREVPENVLRMKHLKHLFVSGVIMVKRDVRDRVHGLELDLQNLETLCFDYQYGYHLNHSSFKKLPNLKKLEIFGAEMQTLEDLSGISPLLQKLESLKLRVELISTSDTPTLDLSRYENLRKLYLFFDTSAQITCSLEFPKKLVKITLGMICMDEENPLKKLQKLPSLEIIVLKKCCAGRMDFSGEDKFGQLQMLMVCDTLFDQVVVDEKGMPKLNKFIYKAHPQQPSEVPEKLRNVMMKMAK